MAWARGIHNEKSAHLRYGVINQAPSTAKARTVTAIPAWDQSERHSLNLQAPASTSGSSTECVCRF